MDISEPDKNLIELIYKIPYFQNLALNDKKEITKIVNFFSAAASEKIPHENHILFLVEGKVEATFSFKDNLSFIYNPTEVINEIALYNNKSLPNSLIALEATKGFYIAPLQFQAFELEHSSTAFEILKVFLKNISRKLRLLNTKATEETNNTVNIERNKNILRRDAITVTEDQLTSIRNYSFFKNLNDDEFKELMLDIKPWKIDKGNIIFSEGERATSCYILAHGKVEVSIINDSHHVRLSLIEPGNLFGEIALIHLGLRSATCTALEDCLVLEYTKRDFERLIESYSILSYKTLKEIALNLTEEYIETLGKANQLSIHTMKF